MRPFEVVNGEGFQNLINETLAIGDSYGVLPVEKLIPDPTTISRNIAGIAATLRQQVKDVVESIMSKYGGGLTTDFWTDNYQKNPYLSITAHFIDDNWELKKAILGIFEWDSKEKQTFDNVNTFLLKKLDDFGLGHSSTLKKLIFVTNEGKNFVKALKDERRLNCAAHLINSVLKTTFEKLGEEDAKTGEHAIAELGSLDACKKLVTHIRQCHMKTQLSKVVIQDVDTRWHSKIDTVDSVLQLWDEIELLLDNRQEKEKFLDEINKEDLAALLDLMKLFRKAILQLETSDNYPTLPAVVLIYQDLLDALNPSSTDTGWIRSIKSKLREAFTRKHLIDHEHRIGTTLYPSFKALNVQMITEIDKRSAHQEIRRLLEIGRILEAGSSTMDYDDNVTATNEDQFIAKHSRVSVDDFLEKFSMSTEINAKDELDNYLSDPTSHIGFTEVLNWWKASSSLYPKLASIARKYLAVPATSAASESAFRFAGLTVTELRNRLAPDTVSNLLFIYHNDKK